MTWIAFGSVPTILMAMLAMGRLEARLLPQTPPPDGAGDPIRTAAASRAAGTGTGTRTGTGTGTGTGPHRKLHWEVVAGPAESREEART
jgi:hypothetical protein